MRVLHIPHRGRAGLVREVGRGVARGEFIQYLDSDDVLYPRKFEVMVGALTDNPECDIAYCYTRRYVVGSTPTDSPSALTGHTWDGHFVFGNARKFNGLPKEVQAALTKNLTAAALKQREDIARLNADAQAELTKLGVTFNKPDPAPFRKVLQSGGFYTEWKGKFGDEVWAKLEKYSGKLV